MSEIVYLGLGTNLGDRVANLNHALELLSDIVRILDHSPIYQTQPWGYLDQPDFLNQVVSAKTGLSPHALLLELKQIEADLGREPTIRYGPRIMDIDILFFGSQVVQQDDLIIPHPQLHERAFVLAPLADIAPEFCHPILKMTVETMLSKVDMTGVTLFDAGDTGRSLNGADI